MNIIARTSILVALLCSFVSYANAFPIDRFSGLQTATATVGTSAFEAQASSESVGGTRKLSATANSGLSGLVIEGRVAANKYSHSQAATITGTTQIIWDNDQSATFRPAGLGSLDLTQDDADAFILDLLSYDFPGGQPTQLVVRVYDATDASGNKWSESGISLSSSIPFGSPISVTVPFANFITAGPAGAADLSKAGAITLTVTGSAPDVDLVIGPFRTNGRCDLFPDAQGRVVDQCGVCGGDNSSCSDCVGVPNGTALPGTLCNTGQAGICSSGHFSLTCSCDRDREPMPEICDGIDNNCNGQIDEAFPLLGQTCSIGQNGCTAEGNYACATDGSLMCSAEILQGQVEQCENSRGCDGVPGSGLVLDDCGICGGDGSTCRDCQGVKGGVATLDRCGVCAGDGNSCVACEQNDQTKVLQAIDNGAKQQERLIKSIYKQVQANTRNKKLLAKIKSLRAEAHNLQVRNWTISWFLPRVTNICQAPLGVCASSSNESIINEYKGHAEQLRRMAIDAIKTLQKVKKVKFNSYYHLSLKADKLYQQNLTNLALVPRFQSVCQ